MLTKRDKLLIAPWQDKRYHQHRLKIQSAGPAIDFYPPLEYPHIQTKLKKQQREKERTEKVTKDNIRLLQKLGSIMTGKRLRNYWDNPRPGFLNREHIVFPQKSTMTPKPEIEPIEPTTTPVSKSCSICSGKFLKPEKKIPEERIPWKPSSPSKNVKILERANVKVHRCCHFCC